MRELAGVALVTGASTGIGRHLAEGLAARGMAVAGLARNGDRLAAAMDESKDPVLLTTRRLAASLRTGPRWTRRSRGCARSSGRSTCWSTTPG